MSCAQSLSMRAPWRLIFLAGLAGGLAEVTWIAGYSAVSGVDGWQVARVISAAISPAWAGLAAAPMMGIGIHFLLSFVLAGVFIHALWAPYLRRHGAAVTLVAGPFSLALVWLLNFFVVLPALHPAFVGLLPYAVTFISKFLFGLALSTVLIARVASVSVIWRTFTEPKRWAT